MNLATELIRKHLNKYINIKKPTKIVINMIVTLNTYLCLGCLVIKWALQ